MSDLVQIVDAALVSAAQRSGPHLVCRPGCTQCCHGVFPISQQDAARLREGLEALDQTDLQRAARIRTRSSRIPHPPRPTLPRRPHHRHPRRRLRRRPPLRRRIEDASVTTNPAPSSTPPPAPAIFTPRAPSSAAPSALPCAPPKATSPPANFATSPRPPKRSPHANSTPPFPPRKQPATKHSTLHTTLTARPSSPTPSVAHER